MNDANGNADPEIRPGDVSVFGGARGFTIAIARHDLVMATIDAGLAWSLAVQRAYLYAAVRRTRVLIRREDLRFEVLDEHDAWLDATRVWHPHDATAVGAHAPSTGGVYVLRGAAPIFVGETDNIRERLLYHLEHPTACAVRAAKERPLQFCVQQFVSFDLRQRRASRLITWWRPECNQAGA